LFDPSQQAIHWEPVKASEFTFVGLDGTVVQVLPSTLVAMDDPPATHIDPLFKTVLSVNGNVAILYILLFHCILHICTKKLLRTPSSY
jgi:hypothetical protein